ncbi:MAG: metal-dependent hydrolase [Bacteroidia bacterium]|nr:metal-dependent hydrolase [Bacteroidia bacterium]
MKITFYGHACFGVEIADVNLLFDPFISPNPLAKDIDINAIPCDFLLVSHAHQDHMADAIAIAQRTGATLISTYEVATWFGNQGLEKVVPLNHGGASNFPFGRLKLVNAIHSSSFPDGSYGGNPAGFVVSNKEEGDFYFSGDTALTYDMKLINEEFDIKFAMLCMGDHFTMGVEDALKAASFVGTDDVIGMHFDTFPPIQIDHAAAISLFEENGKQLSLPAIGETIDK